jgi:3-phenylpropionate/cinnamic acid dioxygenase small subunit
MSKQGESQMDEDALNRLNDEAQIRRTMAKTLLALDGRRFEEYSEMFTEDAVVTTQMGQADVIHQVGRAAIFKAISSGAVSKNPQMHRKHVHPNIVIDVNGDQATVVADLLMFTQMSDEPYSIRIGEYHDLLVRHEGRWLFKNRQIVVQQ